MQGLYFDELSVGQAAETTHVVGAGDIEAFADVSGDVNPVHLNQEFADRTMFRGRIAHGMLTASFISTVIGTKLPGPGCIYVSQNLKFKAPVRAGDTVHTRVIVLDVDQIKGRVRLETLCRVGDVTVVEGEAVLMVPRRLSTAAE